MCRCGRATADGWQIDGCPHHGGSIAAAGDGSFHLAWFTGAGNEPRAFYGRLDLGGSELAQVRVVGGSAMAHPVVLASDEEVWLAWMERRGEKTVIFATWSSNGGRDWRATVQLAATEGAADHPFLIHHGGQVSLTWHTAEGGLRVVPIQQRPSSQQ